MPQRNLIILLVAAAACYACYVRGDQNPYARYAASGLAAIEAHSLEPIPNKELFDAAMSGMVDVLHRHGDAHSQFMNERQTEALLGEIYQHFGGIGVRIHFLGKPQRLVIVAPPEPDTPAARAGLAAGDHIVAIDQRPTAKMTMDDVLVAMRGPAGQPLRLTIERPHEETPITLKLVRDVITVESVIGDRRDADGHWQFALEDEPRIALLRVTSFGELTASEIDHILKAQTAEGVQAVVLDLRDNSGGTLDAAIGICSLLLPDDRLIVETRGRDRTTIKRFVTSRAGPFRDIPLAVLVNNQSASASEIVAACLQDHDRAVIVGERSYGKGTVQQLIATQSGKSLLKLTWASFWRPSGRNIHRMQGADENGAWGVRPDAGFEVALSDEDRDNYRKYRARRDMAGLATLAEFLDDALPAPPDDFVDRPLQLAAAHLKARLDQPSE